MNFNITNGKLELNGTSVPDSLNFLFAGDFCVSHGGQPISADINPYGAFAPVIHELENKDISVINLEAPLTDADTPIKKSGPNIKMSPECAGCLKLGRFDVANLANNHIGDFGPGAVMQTIEILRENGIMTVGAGNSLKDSRKPLWIHKRGVNAAILSFAENEFGMADKDTAGASPLDLPVNMGEIREVSAEADITVVLIHGGNEHNPMPSPRMVKTYRSFVEAGASAVIGMHTHCPQGIEVYRGSPIIYSLGNFLFDIRQVNSGYGKHFNNMWWKSYMARVSFDGARACGLEIIPYTFAPDASKVRTLEGAQKQEFLEYLQYISDAIAEEDQLLKYWSGWCAMNGETWLKYLEGARRVQGGCSGEAPEGLSAARNVLSCEAHNELITTFMRMLHNGSLEEGKKYIGNIKKLQQGEIPGVENISSH